MNGLAALEKLKCKSKHFRKRAIEATSWESWHPTLIAGFFARRGLAHVRVPYIKVSKQQLSEPKYVYSKYILERCTDRRTPPCQSTRVPFLLRRFVCSFLHRLETEPVGTVTIHVEPYAAMSILMSLCAYSFNSWKALTLCFKVCCRGLCV